MASPSISAAADKEALSGFKFFAEAEKNVAGTPVDVIYYREEPETSQHPNYQMMLMKALLALAGQPHRRLSSPPMSRRWPD